MRLRQILLKLLSNACMFTKAGEVKLAARKVSNGSNFVEFAVPDTGVGMTPEQQAKLRSAVVGRIVLWRENYHRAILDFYNSIGHFRT